MPAVFHRKTALHHAAIAEKVEAVKLLLENGAEPSLAFPDVRGRSESFLETRRAIKFNPDCVALSASC